MMVLENRNAIESTFFLTKSPLLVWLPCYQFFLYIWVCMHVWMSEREREREREKEIEIEIESFYTNKSGHLMWIFLRCSGFYLIPGRFQSLLGFSALTFSFQSIGDYSKDSGNDLHHLIFHRFLTGQVCFFIQFFFSFCFLPMSVYITYHYYHPHHQVVLLAQISQHGP